MRVESRVRRLLGSMGIVATLLSLAFSSAGTTAPGGSGLLAIAAPSVMDVPDVLAPATVVATVPVGHFPATPVYDPSNGTLFVSNQGDGTVSAIDGPTQTVVATISVGSEPGVPAYDPANGELYVPDLKSASVSVVSAATYTVATTLHGDLYPTTPVLDSTNGDLYLPHLSDENNTNVTVIDGASNSVIAMIPVGQDSLGPFYDAADQRIYVPNHSTANASVISGTTNTVIATIDLGDYPGAPAFDPTSGDLYFANFGSENVSVVSTATDTVVATIPVGVWPYPAVYDSGNGDVYVANENSDTVSVISSATNTVVATIPVGSAPLTPAYDPADGDLYVPNDVSNNLSVISGGTNRVVGTIPCGAGPATPMYDPSNHDLYVPNYFGASITVVTGEGPTYSLQFEETGLPAGTSWGVTIWSSTVRSTTSSIDFSEQNGTYPYTVSSSSTYTPSAPNGSAPVAGGPLVVSITFTQPPPLSGILGLPGVWGYVLVGAIVAAAAGSLAVVGRYRARSKQAIRPPPSPPPSGP
jgi:YVTN family beta-propeller protein